MSFRKLVVASATTAATAVAGLAIVQNAGAATVDVNGELCTYTYTQADADYVNVAAEAIREIEAVKYEEDEWYRSYFRGPEIEPGTFTVVQVRDAERDFEWDQYRGVVSTVDEAIDQAKTGAIFGINSRSYDADEALLLASWELNGYHRSSLLQHEINKACATGIDTETTTPEDPDFSPGKFPVWDTGESTETSTSEAPTPVTTTSTSEFETPEPTPQESEPSEKPTTEHSEPSEGAKKTIVVTTTVNGAPSTVTSTVTQEPDLEDEEIETSTVNEPVETTPPTSGPSEKPSPEGSSEGGLPLALITGVVAILAAVAASLLPQAQALLNP